MAETTMDEIERKILEGVLESVRRTGRIPSFAEIQEKMGFASSRRFRSHVETLLVHLLEAWEVGELQGPGTRPPAGDSIETLRRQIHLLGSANRALEKQNETLHRRLEHLREQLRRKAEEVERLRLSLRSNNR